MTTTTPPGKARVLIADDSAELTELYCLLINGEPDLQCVATLDSAAEFESTIERLRPNVAVIDLVMPGPSPFNVIRSASTRFPECRILAFSGNDDPHTRDRAFDCGAWALVSKHSPPTQLLEEIRRFTRPDQDRA
jgi:two-component system response regulator DesR